MSSDLSQFYAMFFDEAKELLAQMEELLLNINVEDPNIDDLNAIFRVAHSIKGGAGTFGCFEELAHTTHSLENVLDLIRHGEMKLKPDMVELFLTTKDILNDQISTYESDEKPDQVTYKSIANKLLGLYESHKGTGQINVPEKEIKPKDNAPKEADIAKESVLIITVSEIKPKDADSLTEEMQLMGKINNKTYNDNKLVLTLATNTDKETIEAVCCFVVDSNQIEIIESKTAKEHVLANGLEQEKESDTSKSAPNEKAKKVKTKHKENSTIRVGVEKVDQLINLVGELVITKAMLAQSFSDKENNEDLLSNCIDLLERNVRDLQESVMSIRMMPMDYVFSRFPRVVHQSATKLGKKIKLVTKGQATELDKGLIEKIIDPLTHLVRNSLDHGIEMPESRVAKGKPEEGTLTLSAEHNGGHIVIEVIDDGAGLDRARILEKAISQGFSVNEDTPDDELWQLIFAPGFSTAKKVTDISGRGVGMDVVRKNIQALGGHIQLSSKKDIGTTTRIILPLTLAILDGMSVRVGSETFILPLSNVAESLQVNKDQVLDVLEGNQALYIRNEYLPMVYLHDAFDIDGAVTDITKAITVILQVEDKKYALIVDDLIGQHQVVVKNLETNYRKVPGISAATILGDGSVALILDVLALQPDAKIEVK